jgi:hypothetical protein
LRPSRQGPRGSGAAFSAACGAPRTARQERAAVPGLTPEATARRYDITVDELMTDTPDGES